MAARGLSPLALRPLAEKLTFKAGVMAGDRVTVESRLRGRTANGHLVLGHRIVKNGDVVCVEGTTVRTLTSGDPAPLVAAFESE
jgi:acyl-CoA thioesterase FadM